MDKKNKLTSLPELVLNDEYSYFVVSELVVGSNDQENSFKIFYFYSERKSKEIYNTKAGKYLILIKYGYIFNVNSAFLKRR